MRKHTPDHKAGRVLVLVMDGLGVGELPDAQDYGDVGSCTLGNMAKAVEGLKLPHLGSLGLGNIISVAGVPTVDAPGAAHGKMAMQSKGKDSTGGHWELMGLILRTPFPSYPDGFPPEIMTPFEEKIGRKTLGNKAISGTEVIEELGSEHMRTGSPIVYTSADSVFQIAAHEEIIPIDELYEICEIARGLLTGEHAVGRVIARPFLGEPGSFWRTPRRKDFSVKPVGPTLFDNLSNNGYQVLAVGKVNDIFAGSGVTTAIPASGNREIFLQALNSFQELERGLVFATLVDFDTIYGHRNDCRGYATALEEFDSWLPDLFSQLREDDLVVFTADHGCDPTTPSTDHSREYVPLLIMGPGVNPLAIEERSTMADLGATLADFFGVPQGDGSPIKGIIKE